MNFEQLITMLLKQKSWQAVLSLLGSWILSAILPIGKFLILVVLLIVSDFITGILASQKNNEKLNSRRMSRTLSKSIAYMIAVLLSHAMDVTFIKGTALDSVSLAYLVSFFICTIEFQSNIENIETITGINIWSKLSDYFVKFTQNKLKPK